MKRFSRKKRKLKSRNKWLMKQYKITHDDYLKMKETQGGMCAICGKVYKFKYFHVDHNHKTGKVRALLCAYCNRSLGYFKDDIKLLQHAIDYLQKFSEKILPEN